MNTWTPKWTTWINQDPSEAWASGQHCSLRPWGSGRPWECSLRETSTLLVGKKWNVSQCKAGYNIKEHKTCEDCEKIHRKSTLCFNSLFSMSLFMSLDPVLRSPSLGNRRGMMQQCDYPWSPWPCLFQSSNIDRCKMLEFQNTEGLKCRLRTAMNAMKGVKLSEVA